MRTVRFLVGLLVVSLSLVLVPGAHGLPSAGALVQPSLVATDPNQGGDGDSNGGEGSGSTPGGTTGPAGVSVPRLMLDSLTTDPATVTAGGSFTVAFTLVNTSKKTRVSNIKVSLTQGDGAFLPEGGSSSLYISSIKAEGTASREMVFRSLPSLENRPYSMTLQVDYEDSTANAFTTTETVSVNVEQPSRADTSTFTVSPEAVPVGQEATLNFSLNNLGKTKLHNASVSIAEGQGLQPKTQFIGTVEPGAAANVELSLMALEERMEPVPVVISYEDAAGNVTTLEKSFDLVIIPPEDMTPMPEDMWPQEPQQQGFVIEAWMYWAAGGVLLAVIALIVILKVLAKKRAAKEQADDIELLDDDVLAPQV